MKESVILVYEYILNPYNLMLTRKNRHCTDNAHNTVEVPAHRLPLSGMDNLSNGNNPLRTHLPSCSLPPSQTTGFALR